MIRQQGTLLDLFVENGSTMGRIHTDSGSIMTVSLLLIMNARVGDRLVVESGIALTRLSPSSSEELLDVSGDTRQGG